MESAHFPKRSIHLITNLVAIFNRIVAIRWLKYILKQKKDPKADLKEEKRLMKGDTAAALNRDENVNRSSLKGSGAADCSGR